MTLFRYPGGKSRLKKHILPILKSWAKELKNFVYIEPFFGGGAIGLEFLHHCPRAILNDVDFNIFAVWWTVKHNHTELINKIANYQPKVKDFYNFQKFLLNPPHDYNRLTEIAFKKIAIHQMSYSGLGEMAGGPIGGKNQRSKYQIDCRWKPLTLIKKIAKYHRLLNSACKLGVSIINFDFKKLNFNNLRMRMIDENAIIYLDPPYIEEGNELYRCSFTIDDHEKLSAILRSLPAECRWLLSYKWHPLLKELYPDCEIKFIQLTSTVNSKNPKVNTECLISRS
ncbi:MAG: hypothetical protein DRP85_00885 [Candidatus Makaraimicrobium thalassicum]|nr:MAG: hypothetical protein DRP85_00885 [Candidatus Omnitrophota bacterium]